MPFFLWGFNLMIYETVQCKNTRRELYFLQLFFLFMNILNVNENLNELFSIFWFEIWTISQILNRFRSNHFKLHIALIIIIRHCRWYNSTRWIWVQKWINNEKHRVPVKIWCRDLPGKYRWVFLTLLTYLLLNILTCFDWYYIPI